VAKRGAYTDIYALAATLYFLVTKKLPHPAVNRVSGVALEEPKSINTSLSIRVNDAILKGMELEPENRPQTMQKWLELLKEAPQQNPVKNNQSFTRPPNSGRNIHNRAVISFDYSVYLRRVLAFVFDSMFCVFLIANIINQGGSSIYLFYDNCRKWITSNIHYSGIPSMFYIIIFFVSWLYII
jgi:serine/threonine protein kinase